MINFNAAEFVKSAVAQKDFPMDVRPQIVFAGRSNVGKSSLINKVINRKNFARVGSTPGKTVHINFFMIDQKMWFVDLPGYGYAKVSAQEKKRWGALIEQYFNYGGVSFGVLIVDIRHSPTEDDRVMARWFKEAGVGFVVAANKADKLSAAQAQNRVEQIGGELGVDDDVKVIAFSAEKGTGVNQLIKEIVDFNNNRQIK